MLWEIMITYNIFAKFKHIHGKMETLKSWLKVGMCHPFGKSLTIVMNGSSFSLKWKLDFVDGMKLKHHSPTPHSQLLKGRMIT
jgi:hypothetical protein